MASVILTAKRVRPAKADLTSGKLTLVMSEQVTRVKSQGTSTNISTNEGRGYKRFKIAETPVEYDHAVKIASGLTPFAGGTVNLAASGTTQGTALPVGGLVNYENVVTGATGGSQTGIILPPASTKFNNGGAFVVRNSTSVALSVYPAASEYIDSGASNAPVTVAGFGRAHFYASASNKWLSATVFE